MAANGKPYYDLIGPFPDGIHSGIAPLMLPKTQLAFALNATMRGGYIQDRPPYQIRNFNFNGDLAVQSGVEDGMFQGAGVYRPDFGPSQIVAQIGGRLFAFVDSGAAWAVTEITIPGDLNDTTVSQAWLWQAEKWLIISDGSGKLPIFYDGVSCRRSYGAEVVIANGVAFAPAAPPGIDSIVIVGLAAPYTGPINIPVRFNGAIYQIVATPTGNYTVQLTNVNAPTPGTIAIGTGVFVNPTNIGLTVGVATGVWVGGFVHCITPGSCTKQWTETMVLTLNSVPAVPLGSSVVVNTSAGIKTFTVTAIDVVLSTITMTRVDYTSSPSPSIPGPPATETVAAGELLAYSSSAGPTVQVGTVSQLTGIPAIGSNVLTQLTAAYTGPDNQLVTINGLLYLITAVPAGAPGMTLYLKNLTDTQTYPNYVVPSTIYSIPELPACRMGCYGMGQNWVCLLDGISFMQSDLVGSSSGTQAESFRDAVLKASDSQITGTFRLPNAGYIINAMLFSATLDTSLGQGALIIGTMANFFTCKAPFTLQDFQSLIVQPLQTPILTESLIGFGPLGQYSTVAANSDTMFRSTVGLGSLKLARRDMSDEWSNTPISREVARILDPDNNSPLLQYSSGIVFDNRWRTTCSPMTVGQGILHQGEVALNFDLISSLRGKAPSAYDGLWTGLNVLQFVTGLFGSQQRAFAFSYDLLTDKIQLHELLTAGTQYKDNNTTSILWSFETPVVFNQDIKPLTEVVRLIDGEMYIADLKGTAHVKVQYRPVFYPCWIDWIEFDVCADMTQTNSQPQVRYRLGLGEPDPADCDSINNIPFREACAFQLRFEITGHCVFWGAKFAAVAVPQPQFSKPACNGIP